MGAVAHSSKRQRSDYRTKIETRMVEWRIRCACSDDQKPAWLCPRCRRWLSRCGAPTLQLPWNAGLRYERVVASSRQGRNTHFQRIFHPRFIALIPASSSELMLLSRIGLHAIAATPVAAHAMARDCHNLFFPSSLFTFPSSFCLRCRCEIKLRFKILLDDQGKLIQASAASPSTSTHLGRLTRTIRVPYHPAREPVPMYKSRV